MGKAPYFRLRWEITRIFERTEFPVESSPEEIFTRDEGKNSCNEKP